MTVDQLFAALPVATILSFITATLIPFLSSLLTRNPNFLTGVLTLFLAAASGFFSEWAAHPDNYDWKAGVGTALVAWIIAVITHSKILKGTQTEVALHQVGTKTAESYLSQHNEAT